MTSDELLKKARKILEEEHSDAHFQAWKKEVEYLQKKHPGMDFDKLLKKYYKKEDIDEFLDNLS